jgi:hypothetical protein
MVMKRKLGRGSPLQIACEALKVSKGTPLQIIERKVKDTIILIHII